MGAYRFYLQRSKNEMRKPLTVHGVEWPSQAAFAKHRKVSTSAVYLARKRGKLETVGLKSPPFVYRGKEYCTQAEAARDNGVTRQAVNNYLRRKTNASTTAN